jgi:uncharacterized membrane-anchored protein
MKLLLMCIQEKGVMALSTSEGKNMSLVAVLMEGMVGGVVMLSWRSYLH